MNIKSLILLLFLPTLVACSSSGGSDNPEEDLPITITDITLTNNTVGERDPVDTLVGNFAVVLENGQEDVTFFLTDVSVNAFRLEDNQLLINNSNLDFETAETVTVEITAQTASQESTFVQEFTINVTDAVEITSTADAGAGSLRQAILDAASGDTIYIDASVETITLTSGAFVIDKDLTIIGLRSPITTLDAGNNSRIFEHTNGNTLELQNLKLLDGQSATGEDGGCMIVQNSQLTLNFVNFNGCTANEANGGAIAVDTGTVEMTNVIIAANRASDASSVTNGGGLYIINNSIVTLINTLIDGNEADEGTGGGIFSEDSTLRIQNSTITTNDSVDGAGIYNTDGMGMTIDSELTIISSTITSNSSDPGDGGGIWSDQTIQINNSIVADNSTADEGIDIFFTGLGANSNSAYNFIGSDTNNDFVDTTNNNQVGMLPQLGGKSNNGGFSETHLPNMGSPVLDQIPANLCIDLDGDPLTVDQRLEERPVNTNCDIGAVERNAND